MYNFGDPNNSHGELQPLLNVNESPSNMNEPMQIGGYQQTNDLTNQSTSKNKLISKIVYLNYIKKLEYVI